MSKKQAKKNTTENDCFSDFSSVEDLMTLNILINETPGDARSIASILLHFYKGEEVASLFAGFKQISDYFYKIRKEYHEQIENCYYKPNN